MLKYIKNSIFWYRRLRLYLQSRNLEIGANFVCGANCSLSPKNSIKIGDNFFMGRNCHLASNLDIGNEVMLGSYVSFVGGDHKIDFVDTSMRNSGRDTFKTTKIHDDVWIGHGAIIMHGVVIETGAVIAAGSVVTKNVESNTIVAGNPATILRKRNLIS